MPKRLALATLLVAAVPGAALAGAAPAHDNIDALIEQHARANKVPASFVHRVVKRESNYNAHARGGSALGLMQIKHATARSMGYKGDASGLYDPDTNLKYGIAYLAAAYRAAQGDVDQAYRYYNRGFYYAAKKLGIETTVPDDSVSITADLANSANNFTKMLGLRTGEPAAPARTASTDPAAALNGTQALAYAAISPMPAGAVEVPLPPRRPAALGADAVAPESPSPASAPAVPAPAQVAALSAGAAVTAAAAASADLVEVPLPPRRPAQTVLVAIAKPVARKPKSVEPVVETAAAVPAE